KSGNWKLFFEEGLVMKRSLEFLATLTLILICVIPMKAQVITGTILGTVTDSRGALLPGVKVEIKNVGTNIAATVVTNPVGEYVVPLLQPGSYDVTFEAASFKLYRKVGVALAIDSKVRVDAQLTIGSIDETVLVTAEAIALQTDSSDLNTAVSKQVIENAP